VCMCVNECERERVCLKECMCVVCLNECKCVRVCERMCECV